MGFSQKGVTVHLRRGDYAEADRVCREEIAVNPGNGYAWHLRGVGAIRSGNFDRAVQYILRAIFHTPGVCEMHVNLGVALRALGRLDEAIRAFSEAAKLDASSFESRLLLAASHLQLKQYADAEQAVESALALRPDSPEGWELLATAAHRNADFDCAYDAARKALSLNPDMATSHRVLGDVLTRQLRYDEARRAYEASLRLDPSDSEAHANFAVLLSRMGHYPEAEASYRQALRGMEGNIQAEFGLGVALLMQGKLEEGWPLYASRTTALRVALPAGIPRRDRLPRVGDRVLLTTDQGPGEQILFASLLPDLVATKADLTVMSDDRLVPLFERSFPSVRFIGRTEPDASSFDYQIPLADTARWLRPDFRAFPRHAGYLKPDPFIVGLLSTRYRSGAMPVPLIGVSWRTIAGTKVSTQKTIPLDQWSAVLTACKATFVDLQYGESEEEVRSVASALGVRFVKDRSVHATLDLDSLAAQVATMDLVVTTSNTTAHIAGALNVPTWVFVPKGHGGFWHWFLDREDSPWYPSARLFRQAEHGEWQPALEHVARELARFGQKFRSTS